MMVWLVWLAVLAIGVAWFALVGLLCRQIVAGKWEADYWPPDPSSAAEPIDLDNFKNTLADGPEASVTFVRFDREGGFHEST